MGLYAHMAALSTERITIFLKLGLTFRFHLCYPTAYWPRQEQATVIYLEKDFYAT
jgi:hypothetical protein